MTRAIKFVTVLVASTLLAAPMSALGACPAPNMGVRHSGPHSALMMAHTQSWLGTAAQHRPDNAPAGTCCQVSTQPARFSPPQSGSGNANTAAPTLCISTLVVPSIVAREERSDPPLRASTSPQALLCTFLI